MKIANWLVVKADGSMRLRTKRPNSSNLGIDEVAVPIVVTIPDGWGCVVNDQIDVRMPEPPSFEPVTPESIIAGEVDDENDDVA